MDDGRTVQLTFGWLLTLAGSGLTLWQVREIGRAFASRRWPRVRGRILHSFVDRKESYGRAVYQLRSRFYTSYRVEVAYRYRVGDVEHTGRRIGFGLRSWSRFWDTFARTLKKYPAGRELAIAYDFERPSQAVLEPGFTWNLLLELGPGLLALVFGVSFLVSP
jgi:hypothetical protein